MHTATHTRLQNVNSAGGSAHHMCLNGFTVVQYSSTKMPCTLGTLAQPFIFSANGGGTAGGAREHLGLGEGGEGAFATPRVRGLVEPHARDGEAKLGSPWPWKSAEHFEESSISIDVGSAGRVGEAGVQIEDERPARGARAVCDVVRKRHVDNLCDASALLDAFAVEHEVGLGQHLRVAQWHVHAQRREGQRRARDAESEPPVGVGCSRRADHDGPRASVAV